MRVVKRSSDAFCYVLVIKDTFKEKPGRVLNSAECASVADRHDTDASLSRNTAAPVSVKHGQTNNYRAVFSL